MKNHIVEFKHTGSIEIYIPVVVSQWNNRCSISQWHNQYTLCEDRWVAGRRFSNRGFQISEDQAKGLIYRLGLMQQKSNTFRNGSVWRTLASEERYVKTEMEAYFLINPDKKPTKFVQNVIDTFKEIYPNIL